MSSTYRAAPVTLTTPSLRGTLLPTERIRARRRLPGPGGFQGFAQDSEGLFDFRLRDRQGRGDAEGVAVEAALADQEETLLGLLEDPVAQRFLGSAVARGLVHDELDRLH